MKSFIIPLFTLILLISDGLSSIAFGQEECHIKLSADVQHCTCINNGEIKFKLTKSATCDIDTNNIRYSLYSPSNSISNENSISPIFNNLPPGDYTGIASVLHHTGVSGIGANVIIQDTLHLTLSTSYSEPNAGILNNDFTVAHPFGIVRSISCTATGIVQMKISGGKKPYTIQAQKIEGGFYTFYKTYLFNGEQHSGDDPAKMDYHEYYNIDSLSAGQYKLVLTDACGYTLPPYNVTIKSIGPLESTSDLAINACNDNGENYNRFYINDFTLSNALNYFAQNADYYALRQQDSLETYWKCRWAVPAVNGQAADTSEWAFFKFGRLEHQINTAEKYCDLWDQKATLQIKDVACNSVKSYTIQLQKPRAQFYAFERSINYPSLSYSFTDSCGLHQFNAQKRQYDYEFYPAYDFNKLFTTNEGGIRKIRYHIKDLVADTMIYQGIVNPHSIDLSFKHIFEFDSIYHGRSANFTVTDAKNCTIYSRNLIISSQIFGTVSNPSFNVYELADSANYCDLSKFSQYYSFPLGLSDLDTFQIINSPGHLSDISMVYKADLHQWVRLDSNTNITIGNHYGNLAIHGLRSTGVFHFRYVSGCTLMEPALQKPGNNSGIGRYYVPIPPTYKIEPTCTGVRIIPLQGSYKQHGFSGSANTPYTQNLSAVFRLYGNPSIPEKVTGYYHLGDTIDISIEGDIRIEMCDPYNYGNPEHLCHFRDTVIHCGKITLQYDYFYSYCCQISDTVSTVRTRAKGGVPPYLYVIYDKKGQTLDSNHVGDFFDLPLPHHDTVLLKIFDQCGSNFSYAGQVIEARLIKKAWFDDGGTSKTIKDSSLCELFAITLDSIQYQWYGPNSFYSEKQNPSFFIPKDSNMSGKYYLYLQDPACGILQDSLSLRVVTKDYLPELIWIDDSICSGKDYHRYGFHFSSVPSEETKVFYDTLISAMNDSTFLKLTILPVYKRKHIDSIVSPLEEYHYGMLLLTDTGLHEIKLPSACNCDSIIYIHLMFTKYLPCADAIDFNGNHYPAVRLNKYCWMTENLKSIHYSDGRPIIPTYEYIAEEYPDKNMNVSIFGRLYDWFATIDSGKNATPDYSGHIQGICPEGWILPCAEDFSELSCYTIEQLRSPFYWIFEPGTNESGFNSLPAGYYDAIRQRYSNLLGNAYYWCYSPPEFPVKVFMIYHNCQSVQQTGTVCNGYSVRCIQK